MWTFPPAPTFGLPVEGTTARLPLRRIFCIGRNYADHAAEMGATVNPDAPMFFTKAAQAAVAAGGAIPYPPGTRDLHHEVELVVALGPDGVFGYGVGLDLTRRDLQAVAKDKRGPWDAGKDFDNSAVLAPLRRAGGWAPGDQAITLSVNGQPRQSGHLAQMLWSVPALIGYLGSLYALQPGDIIMTGTPAGVGPLQPGDRVEAAIDGLTPLTLTLQPSE